MENEKFTEAQVAQWRKYEKVRKGGRFNMFMPEARIATGLEPAEYTFVMKNFGALKTQAETIKASS